MFPLHFRQRHHRLYFVRPGHVRNDCGEIEFKLDGVFRVGVGAQLASILPPIVDIGLCVTGATLRAAFSRAIRIAEFRDARAQIIHSHFIEWKHACKRAPFRRHVGNGHARRHGKIRCAIADEIQPRD